MKHIVRAVAAALCLAAAVLLVLIGLDARTWSSRISADDLRYTRDATARRLWQPRELAPFGLARSLLGIDDDLAYRRALRAFRIARPLDPMFSTEATTNLVNAQLGLTNVLAKRSEAVRRVQEANLLGILGFTLSMQSSGNNASVDGAVSAFRRAIGIDPGNDDALFNLEYALDQQKADQSGGGRNPRSTKGSRAGTKPPGHGY